jgi:hypothetical protein
MNLIYPQKILAQQAGLLHVNHICLKPVCQVFLRWVMYEAAVSSVLHLQSVKDQSQSHLFIKYSRNRKQNSCEIRTGINVVSSCF